MFSMIGPYFDGGTVLDLYAGYGGLGDRGAQPRMHRRGADRSRQRAVDTIRDNLKRQVSPDRAEIYRNDARRALSILAKRGLAFDLVFLDPPYRDTKMDEIMLEMEEKQLLAEGAGSSLSMMPTYI